MVLISAHRGGAGDDREAENTLATFERALYSGCDYIEFDVWRAEDDTFRVIHDKPAVVQGPTLDEVLAILRGRMKAHVDLKFAIGELEAVASIVDALGSDNVIITTAQDESVPVILEWSQTYAPGLLVGLSSSPRSGGEGARDRLASWFPRRRLRRSGANLVVSQHVLAKYWLRSYARRRGLPLLVWTVNEPEDLARWMNDPQCWAVATDYPRRALEKRQ